MAKSRQITKRFTIHNKALFIKKIALNGDETGFPDLCAKHLHEVHNHIKARFPDYDFQPVSIKDGTQIRLKANENGNLEISTKVLAAIVTFVIANYHMKVNGISSFIQEYQINRDKKALKEILEMIAYCNKGIFDADRERRIAYNKYISKVFEVNLLVAEDEQFINPIFVLSKEDILLTEEFQWGFQPSRKISTVLTQNLDEVYKDCFEHEVQQNQNSTQTKEEGEGLSDLKDYSTAGSSHANYYEQIQSKFSRIKLNSEFSMETKDIVQLSLSKIDPVRDKKIENLNLNIEKLEKLEPTSIKLSKYRRKLQKLTAKKNAQHRIVSLLESGENIFVHAPAGSGKSTLMRWLMYSIASGEILQSIYAFPIFVELRSFDKNLKNHISRQMDMYQQVLTKNTSIKYVIFIDGFDEYKKDGHILLKEIEYMARCYSAQIIFTGRFTPSFKNTDLSFTIYSLYPYSIENMFDVSIKVIDKEAASRLIGVIENHDLKDYIERPLFFAYVLAYVRKNQNPHDFEELPFLIKNKGKLLKKVIIDDYLGEHEKDRSRGDTSMWEGKRNFQVRVLAKIAFSMTFDLEDNEAISEGQLFGVISEETKKYNTYTNESLIAEYIEHEFLDLLTKGDTLSTIYSFQKKELRYFFAALHVTYEVKSAKEFSKIRNTYVRHTLFGNLKAHPVWNRVEEYIIGILPLDHLLDKKVIKKRGKNYIFTDPFFEHLMLCTKLLEIGIQSNKFDFLDQEKTLDLAVKYLFRYQDYLFSLFSARHFFMFLYGNLLKSFGLFPVLMRTNWINIWNDLYLWEGYYEYVDSYKSNELERSHKGMFMFQIIFESKIPLEYKKYLSILETSVPETFISMARSLTDRLLKKLIVSKEEAFDIIAGNLFNKKVGKWRYTDEPFVSFNREFTRKYLIRGKQLYEFVDFVVENQYIETNLNWARLLKLINTYRIYEERLIFQTSLASKTFITLLNKTFHPSTLEVANESQLFSLGRYLKMFDDFYVDSILDHIHEIIIDSQTKENLRSKLNNFATVCIRPTDIDYLKATLETGNEDQRNLACFYAIQLYCYPRHINVGFEILNCISNVIEQENLNARSCHLIISLMEEGQVIVNDTFRKAILTFYTRHAKYITIYRSANSLINCNLKEAIPFLEHLLSNEYNTHDSYVFYLLHGIDLSYYFKYFDHFSELYITVLEAVTILASACAEPRDKAIKTLESFKTDKVKETLEYATYIGNEKIAYQVKLMYQSSSYFRESERDDLRRTHFTLNSRIEAFQKNGEIEKSQAHHINDSKK